MKKYYHANCYNRNVNSIEFPSNGCESSRRGYYVILSIQKSGNFFCTSYCTNYLKNEVDIKKNSSGIMLCLKLVLYLTCYDSIGQLPGGYLRTFQT